MSIIIIIIKILSQLCWNRLRKFCFSIPIYHESNAYKLHFFKSILLYITIHILFSLPFQILSFYWDIKIQWNKTQKVN